MENESSGRGNDDARAQLDLIAADRQSLARRIARPPWWHTLASTALVAVFVASPLSGNMWNVVLIAAVVMIAANAIDKECDRRLGVSLVKPVGPKSLAVTIVIIAVPLALFAASIGFMYANLFEWIAVTSVSAAVTMLFGLRLLSRVIGRELLNAR